MNNIDQLIEKNIEIEGLLRVLRGRPNAEAQNMLRQAFDSYAALMEQLLGASEASAVSAVSEVPDVSAVSEVPDVSAVSEVSDVSDETDETDLSDETDFSAPVNAEPREQNVKLLKAFTLNDRFRFRRELFEGNDSDFSDTLTILSGMDSYAEAADYLYNDMMWDANNASVSDFMAILAQNMPR